MKKLSSLFLCAVLLLSITAPAYATDPASETQTAGAYLVERGILQGNSSGDLMLEKGLNRAELAAILTRMCGNPEHIAADQAYYIKQCTFSDLPEWAKLYVGFCEANAYMNGYGNGLFGAEDSVNPAAASTVILRYLEYTDSPWDYTTAASKAQELGLLPEGVAEKAAMTRGDMAILIYRAMGSSDYEQSGPTEPDATIPPVKEGTSKNADGSINIPDGDAKLNLKEGDVVRCDDGTNYSITDMSRYDKNAFASGPLPALPTATCDWSSFPEVELPTIEVRHFTRETGDMLFVRNLYETRRMQYTLWNLAGNNSETSENGKLKYNTHGSPYVTTVLSIPSDLNYQVFWPWRDREIATVFNGCPRGTYWMQVWDVYKDGVFIRTEYQIQAK